VWWWVVRRGKEGKGPKLNEGNTTSGVLEKEEREKQGTKISTGGRA